MNEVNQPHHRRVLPVISVVTFIGFLDTHLLIPVMALYAAELGAGVGIIGLVIGLYSITNTPANILFGRLVDRLGGKFPLIAGLVGDALAMFLYSLSRLPVHLALVRAFHGVTGGIVGPATMSITAGQAVETRRAKTMGIYGVSLAAATLVGYGLSGLLVSRLGYQSLFLGGALLLMAGAAISLLLPGTGGKMRGATGAGPAMGTRMVKSLLARRGLLIAYCSIFAQYFTFGGAVTLLPLYVKSLGMEAFHVGMLLVAFAVMFIIVQLPGGVVSDKKGRLILTAVGLSLGTVAIIALPLLGMFPLLAIAMALYGTAYGMLFPSVAALVVDNSAPEERGTATGIFHALITIGVAIGAPVIGWAGEMVGVKSGLMLTSGVMVLALAMIIFASRRS